MTLVPKRIPILYLILAILIFVSLVPLYFYQQIVSINREELQRNEKLHQNAVTQFLARDIEQRQANLSSTLTTLAGAIQIASGGNLAGEHVNTPELRALVEQFVSSSHDVVYATLLNYEGKGTSAGRVSPDIFLQRELERAFMAAREARAFTGQAMTIGSGKEAHTVMLVSVPLVVENRFIGMIGAAIDLGFLIERLDDASKGHLVAYVVDRQGRLVAAPSGMFATGQDMRRFEIVRDFIEQPRTRIVATAEFAVDQNGGQVQMLGTYSPVDTPDWAVVAQKPQHEAYRAVFEMQRTAKLLAVVGLLMSVGISIYAARRVTTPIDILTNSSRAIARGDFSQRVNLVSRTEIGELAQTFNTMSSDLERFVADLKRAAEENRTLFLNSIQMLAGAVDEKDPYTKGHSDRVTRYSVLLATEMGLTTEEIEKIRIAAQLHDVGKIGIEDRILKKPGALTPDEFEIMKTHTTKGANILRPVEMLREMLPGIELHHEALDGRGYPYGYKADQIPLMPRVIMVADTFDAMTTNRPYQAAMDPEYVIRIIHSLGQTKFDMRVVGALARVFEQGLLRLHRAAVVTGEEAEQSKAEQEGKFEAARAEAGGN
jgi:HD-GYP domain-containing protein (c-di-GMP phosphodiesterase class II)